jgi:DinB superfamily
LQKKPGTNQWSAAQCLQHLNVYSEYYIPEVRKAVINLQQNPSVEFKSGWLGNYFTDLMKPNAQGNVSKKMKSPANAVPKESPDALYELERFIDFQHQLLEQLQNMKMTDLNQRLPISISKWIRLKLGDVLLFYVAHEKRHMLQAERAISDSY